MPTWWAATCVGLWLVEITHSWTCRNHRRLHGSLLMTQDHLKARAHPATASTNIESQRACITIRSVACSTGCSSSAAHIKCMGVKWYRSGQNFQIFLFTCALKSSISINSINSIIFTSGESWLANVNYFYGQMNLLLSRPPEKWKVFHKVNFAQKILYWPILTGPLFGGIFAECTSAFQRTHFCHLILKWTLIWLY